MAIFNLFSKRQKRLRGDVPDVYLYDKIPKPLRVQIVHIWQETLGNEQDYEIFSRVKRVYIVLNKILCREYGVFSLVKYPSPRGIILDIFDFFLNEKNFERVLDVIELTFRFIDRGTRDWDYKHEHNSAQKADDAIEELNARFKEHGIGYEFRNREIIRIDSEFIHAEAVKPALKLLSEKIYKSANEEFMQAHEHYRHGRYKDCLTWALKSLESTMKAICDKRKWAYNQSDTAKRLIEICFENSLVPKFWQSHFSALRSILESGVPTARNVMGGHGNGTKPTAVPQYLAAYCLHMTASTLVFLIEAEKRLV